MRGHFLALVLGVSLLGGCASSARFMVEVKPPQRFVCPPDAAMVVFVRPSKFGWAVSANILDEQGRFIGDIPAKGHFATLLPPGPHRFTVWAENTDALQAELAPGHIYFVEVYVTPGVWSAQMHMKAIKPSLPNWALRDQWILETSQWQVDQAGGQAALAKKGGERIAERLRRGQEHLARSSGEELFSRTLTAADGI